MRKPENLAPEKHDVAHAAGPVPHPSGGPIDLAFKGIDALLALMLLTMVAMVLSNVVLRYGFSTGIASSEELSRTLFIWLTFIGAVVATREGTHLGVDSLLRRLPRKGQLAMVFVSESIVLACCVLLFRGTWSQHEVNATSVSLITSMPLIWIYGVAYLTSVGIGLLVLAKLWRIVTGTASDKDIFGAAADHLPVQARSGDGP
ncbi:MAG: TRAP transporter small permease [Hydrogenophaga sp.]|uniref:TRAP transporter small permease n=1 Tax=Hydrogenophaga sp. TaxID=1904254 RepID=UPI003D0B7BD8